MDPKKFSKLKVDERELRQRRFQYQRSSVEESLAEEKAAELLVHPADIFAAVITIQRWFKRVRRRNQERRDERGAEAE